ncbi:MAG: hypothetical protein E7663_04885 [Ruminococcaceae bacterium]|nr:hypothetical protein [Oscillospiraceae bacterium]
MIGSLIRRYKNQLGDSLFSIMGLVLMNAVAQIVAFPLLASKLGEVGYGDLQYLMAYINIITVSVGSAANLARMTAPADERMRNNGDYQLFLLLVALLGLPFTLLVRRFGGVEMDTATAICYYLLFVAMAFRYYVDVAYKLTLRYRRYFVYYCVIGAGYVIGTLLFMRTGIWPLALLVGEMMGVLFAYVRDDTLRRRMLCPSPAISRTFRIILLLCLSEGISNLIFNADRLMLKLLIDASAVTVYYLATLVGKTVSMVTTPLNGVLIGYLARYEGDLDRRMMNRLLLGTLGAVLLFTGICAGGGFVALWLLYPAELEAVKPYLLLGSLAQVLYFITSIFTVILLRFASKGYQVVINGVFGVCFFGFSIPATLSFGINGFALAMVGAGAVRYLTSILCGYRRAGQVAREKKSAA